MARLQKNLATPGWNLYLLPEVGEHFVDKERPFQQTFIPFVS